MVLKTPFLIHLPTKTRTESKTSLSSQYVKVKRGIVPPCKHIWMSHFNSSKTLYSPTLPVNTPGTTQIPTSFCRFVCTSRQIRHSFLESLYRMFRSQNSQKCLCGMLRKSYSSSSNPRVLDVHRMISFAMMHLYFGKKHAQHILHCQINKKK